MPNRPKIIFSFIAIMVVLALGFLFFGNNQKVPDVKAATTDDIAGYAWSENIGWVSFNCTNTSCAGSNYGVNLNGDNTLSGYAWSDSIGWISFNAADVAGCPAGTCQPRLVGSVFSGWARALSNGDGWDGWISLNCANSGVCGTSNYQVTLSGVNFIGNAWGGDVIGWLEFNPTNGGVFLANTPPTAINLGATQPDYCSSGPSATLSWTFSDPDSGSSQTAYQAQISTDAGFTNNPSFLSNSGGGTWGYLRPIVITGSTAGAQTNYQVNISLTTAAMGNPYTHVKTDGSDLRFTNASGTELSYWIESWNNAGTSSVWVKVDSIPASPGTATINMYYGNASAASASNGANTFQLFDDFNGSSLDATKWTLNSGSSTVSGGQISLPSVNSYIRSNTLFGTNVAVRGRLYATSTGAGSKRYLGFADGTGCGHYGCTNNLVNMYWYGSSNYLFGTESGGVGGENTVTLTTSWTIDETQRNSTTSAIYYQNNSLLTTRSTNIPSVNLPVVLGTNNNGITYYDWILVRKYISPEPSVGAPGSETAVDIIKDTGKITSSSNSYATLAGTLVYNQIYYWRVMVWDNNNTPSVWANGPNFSTPVHAYPTADFTYVPANPAANQTITFTDASAAFGGATIASRNWDFCYGTTCLNQTASGTPVTHQYPPPPQFYSVKLTVQDSNSFQCSTAKFVNVSANPQWKEVIPR